MPQTQTKKRLNQRQLRDFLTQYDLYSKQYGLSPDPYDPQHFYDYEAAYLNEGGIKPDDSGHMPSKYKLEGHPRLFLQNEQGQSFDTRTGEVMPYINPYQFNSIVTRPRRVSPQGYMYNAGENIDPLEEQQQLLTNKIASIRSKGNQPEIAQQKPSVLGSILRALPQALAVGISDNPGQALQLQFERQQQEQLALAEAQENRRREKERYERDLDLFDLNQQVEALREKRAAKTKQEEIKAEKQFRTEERLAGQEFTKEQTKEQRLFDDKRDEKNFEQQKQMLSLNTQAQLQIDEVRRQDKKQGDALELSLVLIRNKVDPNTAQRIAEKKFRGEALDKKESQIISRALVPVVKKGIGGSGQGTVKFKDLLDYREAELRAFQTGYNAVDRINTGDVDPLTKEPRFRVATEEERMNAGIKSRDQFKNATGDILNILQNQANPQRRQAGTQGLNISADQPFTKAIIDSVKVDGVDATNKIIDAKPWTADQKRQAKAIASQASGFAQNLASKKKKK